MTQYSVEIDEIIYGPCRSFTALQFQQLIEAAQDQIGEMHETFDSESDTVFDDERDKEPPKTSHQIQDQIDVRNQRSFKDTP